MYCIALTEKYPDLRATLVDFSPVCKVAMEFVQESRTRDRIKIVEGDVLTDELTVKGDVILLSQVLHGMSEQQCRSLVKKCYDWTLSDGIIIVHEFILDDSKAGPLYPALFALNMLITTPEGNAYTKGDLTGWLKEAGYSEISYHHTHGPSTFIIGCKR